MLIPAYNQHSIPVVETTVKTVGRKYFTVDADSYGKYRIEDGYMVTNYPGQAMSIRTPERHARIQRQETANRRLRELGVNPRGERWPYTVEQLEAVIKILEQQS